MTNTDIKQKIDRNLTAMIAQAAESRKGPLADWVKDNYGAFREKYIKSEIAAGHNINPNDNEALHAKTVALIKSEAPAMLQYQIHKILDESEGMEILNSTTTLSATAGQISGVFGAFGSGQYMAGMAQLPSLLTNLMKGGGFSAIAKLYKVTVESFREGNKKDWGVLWDEYTRTERLNKFAKSIGVTDYEAQKLIDGLTQNNTALSSAPPESVVASATEAAAPAKDAGMSSASPADASAKVPKLAPASNVSEPLPQVGSSR